MAETSSVECDAAADTRSTSKLKQNVLQQQQQQDFNLDFSSKLPSACSRLEEGYRLKVTRHEYRPPLCHKALKPDHPTFRRQKPANQCRDCSSLEE